MSTIAEELNGLLDRLSAKDQRRLLDYARALANHTSPQGPPIVPPHDVATGYAIARSCAVCSHGTQRGHRRHGSNHRRGLRADRSR